MMTFKYMIMIALGLCTLANASMDGRKLLEEKCSSCHMLNSSTKIKQDKISAPPMWGIMRNLDDNFKTKEEKINFILDYAMNPSEEKMVFAKAAKKRFGLMPSMKGKLSDDELREITKYLYR